MKTIIYKYNLIFIFLYCCLFASTLYGQTNSTHYKRTLESLNRIELKMDKHYSYLKLKKQFEDPISRINFLYKTIHSVAPDLMNKTNEYNDDLLVILKDDKIKKNIYTNIDITYILYNQCLKNYIDVVDTVFNYYTKGVLNFQTLELFVLQDFNVSNQIAKNYKNKNVQILISKLIGYFKSKKVLLNQNELEFVKALENIKSGKDWDDTQKYAEKLQPPLLKIYCE